MPPVAFSPCTGRRGSPWVLRRPWKLPQCGLNVLREGGVNQRAPWGWTVGGLGRKPLWDYKRHSGPCPSSVSSVTPWLPQAGRERRIFCPQVPGHSGGNASAGSVPFPGAPGRLRGLASLEAWPSPLGSAVRSDPDHDKVKVMLGPGIWKSSWQRRTQSHLCSPSCSCNNPD